MLITQNARQIRSHLLQRPEEAAALIISDESLDKLYKTRQAIDELIKNADPHDLSFADRHATLSETFPAAMQKTHNITYDGLLTMANNNAVTEFIHLERTLRETFQRSVSPLFANNPYKIFHYYDRLPASKHTDDFITATLPITPNETPIDYIDGNERKSFPEGYIACVGTQCQHMSPDTGSDKRNFIAATQMSFEEHYSL